jgi:hypothetical protein
LLTLAVVTAIDAVPDFVLALDEVLGLPGGFFLVIAGPFDAVFTA